MYKMMKNVPFCIVILFDFVSLMPPPPLKKNGDIYNYRLNQEK